MKSPESVGTAEWRVQEWVVFCGWGIAAILAGQGAQAVEDTEAEIEMESGALEVKVWGRALSVLRQLCVSPFSLSCSLPG